MRGLVGVLIITAGSMLAWSLPGFEINNISLWYVVAHNVIIGLSAMYSMYLWND